MNKQLTFDGLKVIPFQQRLGTAPYGKGFRQDTHWIWCGSVARDETGLYHLFASRWPKTYPFFHGYLAASEVVRATSRDILGPYRFQEIVLPARGAAFWDGRVTHNPFIIRYGEEYLLFYIGTTFEGDLPGIEEMHRMREISGGNGRIFSWYESIRIGVARARKLEGPWVRDDSPILEEPQSMSDSGRITAALLSQQQ